MDRHPLRRGLPRSGCEPHLVHEMGGRRHKHEVKVPPEEGARLLQLAEAQLLVLLLPTTHLWEASP